MLSHITNQVRLTIFSGTAATSKTRLGRQNAVCRQSSHQKLSAVQTEQKMYHGRRQGGGWHLCDSRRHSLVGTSTLVTLH
jgi:hypothetical protein